MSEGRRPLAIVIAAVAVLVGIAVAFALSQGRGSAPVFPVIFLAAVAALVFVSIAASRVSVRRATAAWNEAVAAMGLRAIDLSAPGAREAAFAPFAHIGALKHGAKKLMLAAEGRIDGRPVVLARHQFVISTGKSSQTITHTLAATPVPAGWPDLTIEPEHLGHKIAAAFGKKDVRVADDAFDRAWHVKPGGPGGADFALLLLGPETQAFLMSLPRRDRGAWTIGRGWLVHAVRRQVKPSEIAVNCGQLAGLLATVPAELDAWDPGVVS